MCHDNAKVSCPVYHAATCYPCYMGCASRVKGRALTSLKMARWGGRCFCLTTRTRVEVGVSWSVRSFAACVGVVHRTGEAHKSRGSF